MTPFEDELKKALARCEPPDGFTDRLVQRIAARQQLADQSSRKMQHWRWATAAALLVFVTSFAFQREQRREHLRDIQGEAAKEKLLIALRITGSRLQRVQQQIQEVEKEGKQ